MGKKILTHRKVDWTVLVIFEKYISLHHVLYCTALYDTKTKRDREMCGDSLLSPVQSCVLYAVRPRPPAGNGALLALWSCPFGILWCINILWLMAHRCGHLMVVGYTALTNISQINSWYLPLSKPGDGKRPEGEIVPTNFVDIQSSENSFPGPPPTN